MAPPLPQTQFPQRAAPTRRPEDPRPDQAGTTPLTFERSGPVVLASESLGFAAVCLQKLRRFQAVSMLDDEVRLKRGVTVAAGRCRGLHSLRWYGGTELYHGRIVDAVVGCLPARPYGQRSAQLSYPTHFCLFCLFCLLSILRGSKRAGVSGRHGGNSEIETSWMAGWLLLAALARIATLVGGRSSSLTVVGRRCCCCGGRHQRLLLLHDQPLGVTAQLLRFRCRACPRAPPSAPAVPLPLDEPSHELPQGKSLPAQPSQGAGDTSGIVLS